MRSNSTSPLTLLISAVVGILMIAFFAVVMTSFIWIPVLFAFVIQWVVSLFDAQINFWAALGISFLLFLVVQSR